MINQGKIKELNKVDELSYPFKASSTSALLYICESLVLELGKPPISYTPDSFIKYCSSNFAGGMPSLLPCLRTGL